MIIKELQINNFLAIQQANICLENRGLLSISGVNKDDPSAQSNGAGKSSIVDAICWCLYGSTARGISADEVVNDQAKVDCSVGLKIQDGNDIYEVVRFRKDSNYKNSIKIAVNGVDVSLPTNIENDKHIVKLIGIPENIFKVTVYCGQESMPYLPAMTDKQIKELIENAAGISDLQKAYELARLNKSQHEAMSNALETQIKRIKDEIFSLEGKLKIEQAKVTNWENDRQTELNVRRDNQAKAVARLQQEIAEFHEEYKEDVSEQIKNINQELGQSQAIRDEYEAKVVATNSALYACDSLANVIDSKKLDIEHLEEEIVAIKTGLKNKCPTCGRAFSEADIAVSTDSLYQDIKKIRNELDKDDIDFRMLHKDYEAKKKERDEVKSKIPDTSVLTRELQRLNDIKLAKSRRYNQLSENKNFLVQQQLKIDNLKNTVNPNITALQSTQDMLDNKTNELQKTKDDSADVIKQMVIDENLVAVFSPGGVRAEILDTVTPFLNTRTNKYLSTLSCGNLVAEWNTLNKTKTGDIREKFQINVTNKHGAKNYKGLSGGEKRKVNLACVLALQDLAATRAKKSFNLWIGDEIDDALDDTGLELLMSVLNEKAQEKGTVLIISHNDLKDWISQGLVITKENNVSTING